MQPDDDVTLVYDGQCPVCTIYGRSVDLEAGAGELKRVNAREDAGVVQAITKAGLDLDDGMVVKHRGQFYHGADALHIMALYGSRKGLANRLNRALFGSQSRSRLLYPVLRAGRNLLLRLLGRSKIDNLARNAKT